MSRETRPSATISLAVGLISVLAVLLVVSCSSSDEGPFEGTSPPGGSEAGAGSGSGAAACGGPGFPCLWEDVDEAVLELDSKYTETLVGMLETGTREAAFDWINGQPGVVAADLDDTMLIYRLEGAMPSVIMQPLRSPESTSSTLPSQGAGPVRPVPISMSGRNELTTAATAPGRVVGEGTSRELPNNRKRALFLTPYEWQGLSMFAGDGPDPVALLREIPDYNHDPNDVEHLTNDEVTPEVMRSWGDYDAIFFETHGGQNETFGTWLAIGVKQPWDPGTDTKQSICTALKAPYRGTPGLECSTLIDHDTGQKYINLGLWPWFFRHVYGDQGGLEQAIVYVGGCLTIQEDLPQDVAKHVAGTTSTYFGWSNTVFFNKEGETAERLLFFMALSINGRGRTAAGALKTLCDYDGCGGPGFSPSGRTWLRQFADNEEPKQLRLYDVPTLRDPGVPTNLGPGLEDGASLQIEGTPGDGVNDQVQIAVDLVGVIDPNDTSASPSDFTNISLSQTDSVADLYNLSFFLGDDQVSIGRDNLGRALDDRSASPPAVVTQLNVTTYRYIFTADLPFDVSPEGTDTSLKVVVELPEGGISGYSVDVTLVGGEEALAVVTIGGQTWRFEGDGLRGCQLSDDGSQLLAGGTVDDALEVWLSANLTLVGVGTGERLRTDNLARIQVRDDLTHQTWSADPADSTLAAFAAIPGGSSQIDSLTMEGSHAWGTATFIEMGAVGLAWSNHTPLPTPVSGSFDIECGSGRTLYGF